MRRISSPLFCDGHSKPMVWLHKLVNFKELKSRVADSALYTTDFCQFLKDDYYGDRWQPEGKDEAKASLGIDAHGGSRSMTREHWLELDAGAPNL